MKPVSVDQAVAILNEALELDSVAINNLLTCRVLCNKALAKHASIQVGIMSNKKNDLGVIGLINGIFGVQKSGEGYIGYEFEKGKVVKFFSLGPMKSDGSNM